MPPTKSGSKKVAIALSIARRSARKGKKYADGGEVETPLWLESGIQETPNESLVDMTDPSERAALRTRRGVNPQLGRGETPGAPLGAMATMAPFGIARGVAALPNLATKAAAAGALGTTGFGVAGATGAKPIEFNWSDPDKERTARINNFPTTMNNLNREMRAASKARMPSVGKQIDTAKAEYEALLAQRARDRDAARERFEADFAEKARAEKEKRELETSFFDKNPSARPGLMAGAGALAALGGWGAGKRLPIGRAIGAGSVAGGIEGGLSQYIPLEVDASTLPETSPAQQKAAKNFIDPEWWGGRVAPAIAGGAAIGGLSAFKSGMGRYPKLPMHAPAGGGPQAPIQPSPGFPSIPGPQGAASQGMSPSLPAPLSTGPSAPTPSMPPSFTPREVPQVRRAVDVPPPVEGGAPPPTPFSNRAWARQRREEYFGGRADQSDVTQPTIVPSPPPQRRPSPRHHSYRDPETGRWASRPPEMQAGGSVGGREWTSGLMRQQTTHDRLKSQEEGMERRQQKSHGQVEDTSSYYWQNPREDTNPHNSGREQHLAGGGATQQIPWAQRAAAQRLSFAGGMLNSPVPGRTDKLNLSVPAGSYVIPSSVVSFLGQDNSAAGAGVLDSMFSSGPAGSKMGGKRNFRSPKARMGKRSAKYGFAEGGDVEAPAEEVPIVAAGGEYIVPPEALMEKFGDLDYGHKVMDQFVKEARQKHIKTLKKLPGPER